MLHFRLTRVLAGCALLLLAGHLACLVIREAWGVSPDGGMVRQLDLNAEGNLAAWFSSFVLTASAGTALAGAIVRRLRRDAMAGRWFALAAFFLLMAVDETAQLHDMATGPLRHGLDLDFGALYFAWLIPALVVVVAAGICFAPLVASLSATVRPRLVLAAVVYLAGAVGCEMIGGSLVAHGRKSLPYLTVMTFEETLEVLGGVLFLTALLHAVRELRPEVVLRWTGAAPAIALATPAPSPHPTSVPRSTTPSADD